MHASSGFDHAATTNQIARAASRVEKLRYMHRNPVKRGLVLEPQQWRWSSYQHCADGARGAVLVNEERKAELRVQKMA
jgi:hypothetical protein